MINLKTMGAVAITLMTLLVPTLAHADRNSDDRRFDRGYNSDPRWNHDRFDHQRDFHHDRDYGRRYGNGYGYNNGYGRQYYYGQPQNLIIVNRPTPYDRPVDYRTYSNTRTVIYGDGNLVPLQGGTTYYYYGR